MKPHLPITLLAALFGAVVAQALEIPDSYETIQIYSANDFNGYLSNHEKCAFLLFSDINYNSSYNITGNLIFTSANENSPTSLSFSGRFCSNTNFDTLSNLTFSNQKSSSSGGSVYISGDMKFIINNVNDGVDDVNTADIVFSNNKVTTTYIVGNREEAKGGAICGLGKYSLIDISNNGNVDFCGNSTATFVNSYSYDLTSFGGAMYSSGVININNNNKVSYRENYAFYADFSNSYGGAIYSTETANFSGNGEISFIGNYTYTTSSSSSTPYNDSNGGAIYSTGTFSIDNNDKVLFDSNYAASSAYYYGYNDSNGGAIYTTGIFLINNNKEVTFKENYINSNTNAYGGAIYSSDTLIINNNEKIVFSNNYVTSAHSSYYRGAGIYSRGNITVSGNGNVIFEKNYEKNASGNLYRLRSIYMSTDSDNDSLILSAKKDGHITFYDSVYMSYNSRSSVSLNSDYEDANGVTQKAGGDIVFSGRYTEEHLKEVKGGVAGTATEIANSRTSELLNTINIYGGTLRVEDKATLKTHAINVVADGNATMKVLDAEVNASTYDVNINSTGQLTIGGTDGSAKLTANNININQGATLSVERTEVPEPVPAITLAAEETVSIFNEKLGGVASGNLNLAAGSTYKADGAHLSVINGTLTFNATEGEKINLMLTLYAEYEKDSQVILFTDVNIVKFVLDNITTDKSGQSITLNASDYFTGDWINEKTSLVYDSGTVYLTGVNRVVPEPSTATLSLLALAALAARRCRR